MDYNIEGVGVNNTKPGLIPGSLLYLLVVKNYFLKTTKLQTLPSALRLFFAQRGVSNIQKLVAQTDIIFSNSMVEAVNKRMKYDFLFTTKLLNIEQTIQYLTRAVEQYNNKPHSALFGLTPMEVFGGMLPDKDMYKPALLQAVQKRKLINLNEKCLNCLDK